MIATYRPVKSPRRIRQRARNEKEKRKKRKENRKAHGAFSLGSLVLVPLKPFRKFREREKEEREKEERERGEYYTHLHFMVFHDVLELTIITPGFMALFFRVPFWMLISSVPGDEKKIHLGINCILCLVVFNLEEV